MRFYTFYSHDEKRGFIFIDYSLISALNAAANEASGFHCV